MTVNHFRLLAACVALSAVCACAADAAPSGITRVTFKTSDLGRSERFYRDVLGFEKLPAGARFAVNERQSIELVAGRADAADHHLVEFALDGSKPGVLVDPDGNRIVLTAAAPRAAKANPRRLSMRLRHVGIYVADLDRAARFYRDQLGLKVEDLQHGKTRWINMHLPNGDFIQMQTAPDSAPAERRHSFEHFGLDVQDAHATYKALLGRGIAPRAAFEPVVGYAGHLKINFLDPENMLIEFMELGVPGADERRER